MQLPGLPGRASAPPSHPTHPQPHPTPPPNLRLVVRLEIDILVPHEGAKHIVIGSAGAGVAFIHDQAQADLQRMWGRPVDLLLRVGVAKR